MVLQPRRLTIVAAAKLLGVSRVNFSRFIHGHITLSADMARRLHRTFGIDVVALLHHESDR